MNIYCLLHPAFKNYQSKNKTNSILILYIIPKFLQRQQLFSTFLFTINLAMRLENQEDGKSLNKCSIDPTQNQSSLTSSSAAYYIRSFSESKLFLLFFFVIFCVLGFIIFNGRFNKFVSVVRWHLWSLGFLGREFQDILFL